MSFQNILKNNSGFTLIEMLVSVSIMIIMMSVVLLNYHRFDNTFNIANLAYDIALTVRKAQTYGVAVHANLNSGPNPFQFGYGIHFDPADQNHYILFSDPQDTATGKIDNMYSNASQLLEKYTLQSGYILSSMCTVSPGSANCNQVTSGTALDITFLRPNPDAYIYSTQSGTKSGPYTAAKITITAPDSTVNQKTITILSTGQISVQ